MAERVEPAAPGEPVAMEEMAVWVATEERVATAIPAPRAATAEMAEMAARVAWEDRADSEPKADKAASAEMAAQAVSAGPVSGPPPRSASSTAAPFAAARAASQAWVGLAEPLEQTAPMGLVAREAMGDLPAWPEMAATAELAMLQIQMAATGGLVAMSALRELEEPEA